MPADQHARHGTESILALADTLPARCEVAEGVRSSAGLDDGLAKEEPGHVADDGLAELRYCGDRRLFGCRSCLCLTPLAALELVQDEQFLDAHRSTSLHGDR